jgi:hypothetical protein
MHVMRICNGMPCLQTFADKIRDMQDPHAQWTAALGNLDPTTTADPSLSTMEWWTKHCMWLAKDAQHNCFAIDEWSYGCDVTNCPHLECLCRGFAGDGSLPPAPDSDAAHVHALVTAATKIYRLQSQVLNAEAVLSTLMERRNTMVGQSSSGDNATGVGESAGCRQSHVHRHRACDTLSL